MMQLPQQQLCPVMSVCVIFNNKIIVSIHLLLCSGVYLLIPIFIFMFQLPRAYHLGLFNMQTQKHTGPTVFLFCFVLFVLI